MKNHICLTLAVAVLTLAACSPSETSVVAEDHFHPKGKAPSEFTLAVFEKARETLPFSDRRDFEESDRGFIAAPDSKIIMADAGHVAWDMERYEFLLEPDKINSVHAANF